MRKNARQSPEKQQRLLEQQKDHDERVHGVRPDLVLDITAEDADWIRNPMFWQRRGSEET